MRLLKKIFNIIKKSILMFIKAIRLLWREHHFLVPLGMWKKYFKALVEKYNNINLILYNPYNKKDYNLWLIDNEKEEDIIKLNYSPLISVIIPVYNVESKYLKECLESVLNQTYTNIEIYIVDNSSANIDSKNILKKYQKNDNRVNIIYNTKTKEISEVLNSTLKKVEGKYITILDSNDIISRNTLYEMVKVLNKNSEIDLIYTDEDKIDDLGNRFDPCFKSDYAPDTLLSCSYFSNFTLLRTNNILKIGGWRKDYKDAENYDLFLRFVEKTNSIYHIAKVLYHSRIVIPSKDGKAYKLQNEKKAIEEALKRRNIIGKVSVHEKTPYYIVNYGYKKEPKVSILIPTRDYASTLEVCLKSIYEKTTYKNYEVIILNNSSVEEETFKLFEKYSKIYKNFKVIDINTEFNFSNICNIGVEKAKGDYIVLLNNDTELLTENWLEIMVGYAMQEHIGTVGVKLYYPDNTIQHGGVIMGLGGLACHAFLNYPGDDIGYLGRLSVPYNYSVNTAACLMVSKKKYLEVGGLEETLKVAFNDVDFNLKLLEKGYYNIFVPQVELYHYESKSRGLDSTTKKYKRFLEESNYMHKKWNKYIEKDPFYNNNLSKINNFMLDNKIISGRSEKNERK